LHRALDAAPMRVILLYGDCQSGFSLGQSLNGGIGLGLTRFECQKIVLFDGIHLVSGKVASAH